MPMPDTEPLPASYSNMSYQSGGSPVLGPMGFSTGSPNTVRMQQVRVSNRLTLFAR